ncbi:MAG: glycoside hydrolase family 172 protein [Streptosporangiales bacterium]
MTGPLANLPTLLDVTSRRASSWDRTGGNDDRLHVAAGERATLAAVDRPGVVRHIWMTLDGAEPHLLRRLVLRAYWDGSEQPCVEVPVGDFFGIGHARTRNYWSLPLQMSPEDGRGLNCWFPMPFDSARIEIANDGAEEALVYYYVDYEETSDTAGLGRFHAQWRRQNPCAGISDEGMSNEEFQLQGENPGADGNYVILEATGRGHYVGCNLAIHNLRGVDTSVHNWYGEGDDMIFVDGEAFPPSLHGTGTEDYFNTAWCPTQEYSSPYHGITLPGGANWSGQVGLYRFHIEDPVRFRESIRVTIEHGHANHRSDDYASTAYWYQTEPHAGFPSLPGVQDRMPRPSVE